MCVMLMASGQRAPFAGSRPNGYKDKLQTDNLNTATSDATTNIIVDRFGGNTNAGVVSTTQRLPHLALGDREIVDRLNTFPVDQRPFWLVNAQAIEAQKNQGRPSNPTNQNAAGEIGNRFGSGDSNTVSGNRPNYPVVVYPLEMSPDQQRQTQQMLNSQIQQSVSIKNNNNNNNNAALNSNPAPSRIVVQKPVVAQQTINNGPTQIQGRPNSGYNG